MGDGQRDGGGQDGAAIGGAGSSSASGYASLISTFSRSMSNRSLSRPKSIWVTFAQHVHGAHAAPPPEPSENCCRRPGSHTARVARRVQRGWMHWCARRGRTGRRQRCGGSGCRGSCRTHRRPCPGCCRWTGRARSPSRRGRKCSCGRAARSGTRSGTQPSAPRCPGRCGASERPAWVREAAVDALSGESMW